MKADVDDAVALPANHADTTSERMLVNGSLERCFSAKARMAPRAKVVKAAPRAAVAASATAAPRRAARAS